MFKAAVALLSSPRFALKQKDALDLQFGSIAPRMQAGGLTTDERARYDERQRANMRPLMRFGLWVGAFLFALHAAWDTLVAAPALATVVARLGCAVTLLGLVPLCRVAFFRARPELLMYGGVTASALCVSIVSTHAVNASHYATGGLLLMILVISALAPTLKAAVVSSALLFGAFFAVALARDAGGEFIEAVAVFVASGALIGCVMSEVRSRIRQRVFGLEVELERVARTDALSGVLTRRAFVDAANIEFQRARRYGFPLSVLMIDIDHFKALNDAHGHGAGDEAIRMLGETCSRLLRTSDLIGRMGGEEFAVVLPHTDLAAAEPLANRLREAVGALLVRTSAPDVRFTVSVGVAMRIRADDNVLETINRADRALYDAKHAGRNRVMPARAA